MKNPNIVFEEVRTVERLQEYVEQFQSYWTDDQPDGDNMRSIAEVAFGRFILYPDQLCCYLIIDQRTNQVVGFTVLQFQFCTCVFEKICYLADLFVSKPYRRQGIARDMIEFVFEFARSRHYDRVYWITRLENTEAQALYDAVATRETHVWYNKYT